MKSTEENIELLSRTVLSEAKEESDQVLVDARENADAIKKRAQEQAEEEHAKIIERAAKNAERIRGQAIATTQLKARNMQLESREKILDRVFASAREQLGKVQQRTDYDQIVKRLLHESLVQLKANKAEIRADEKTMQCLTGSVLDEIANELKVEVRVGCPLEKGTGIVVNTENGHIHFDNTFDPA